MVPQLLGNQVVVGYLKLLLRQVAGYVYHLHTVLEGRLDGARAVGGGYEEDVGEVVVHVQVIVVEGAVLLRVQGFQEGAGGIALEIGPELVHLVKDDYGVGGSGPLDSAEDTAGKGAHVGFAVTADLRLVVHATKGNPDVLGRHTYNGIVRYKQGRDTISLPFESFYEVMEPSASVMNEDLNIIYRDFNNRYVVSVPGYTDSQIKVTVSGATSKREGKFYVLRPTEDAKNVKITVSVDMGGGKMTVMGEKNLRVKKLPDPTPYFMDGNKQVSITKTARKSLNKNTILEVGYGEDGLLQVPFEITSFETYILRKSAKSNGNKFSPAQLKAIGQLQSGEPILVQNIRYRAQGGKEELYNGNLTLVLK